MHLSSKSRLLRNGSTWMNKFKELAKHISPRKHATALDLKLYILSLFFMFMPTFDMVCLYSSPKGTTLSVYLTVWTEWLLSTTSKRSLKAMLLTWHPWSVDCTTLPDPKDSAFGIWLMSMSKTWKDGGKESWRLSTWSMSTIPRAMRRLWMKPMVPIFSDPSLKQALIHPTRDSMDLCITGDTSWWHVCMIQMAGSKWVYWYQLSSVEFVIFGKQILSSFRINS